MSSLNNTPTPSGSTLASKPAKLNDDFSKNDFTFIL